MNIGNENSLLNDNIYAITKFTTLDFQNHLSAIIWFAGCNMRCNYCYNKDIVLRKGKIKQEEVLDFLKSRVGMLDGVVLSGGEATLYKDIVKLSKKIKNLGYDIKLDTNGTNPTIIKRLIKNNLLDFIALDYKANKSNYFSITKNSDFEKFNETLTYLIEIDFAFEVRTTYHSSLMSENNINEIIKDLVSKGYKNRFYLQNFLYTGEHIGDINEQDHLLDRTKILNIIDIEYRNFR